MPELELTASKPPEVVFRNMGRNDATTFTGLCANHDRDLFRPIEVGPTDIRDSQHLFLLTYRAVFKEAHASRKSAIDTQLSFQKGVEQGIYPKDQPSAPGMLAVDHMVGAYLVEDVKTRFDLAYRNEAWDAVDHQVLIVASKPAVAVNSMFSTNLYSNVLDAPAFVMLNVFPIDQDRTAVVFSFLKEQRTEAAAAFGHTWSSNGAYQQYEVSKLILRKCQNVAIAPDFFDTFTDHRREVVRQYFFRNMAGHTFELDAPGLFLFWPLTDRTTDFRSGPRASGRNR